MWRTVWRRFCIVATRRTMTGSNIGLNVTEADNDAALVLTTTSLTVTEAGSASFGVKLAAKPTGSVTIDTVRASGDTDLTITTGASLVFTTINWNTSRPAG